MMFVYVLKSESDTSKFYVGLTDDPARRLAEHNGGLSAHTKKFRPWKNIVTIGFVDAFKASAFEKYLKSGSGRAFAKKHC